MREILFRGKSTNFGWAFSDRIDGINYLGFNGDIPLVSGIPVKPDTLSQYTGLTDSKGVKIFEGDIASIKGIDDHGEVVDRKKYVVEDIRYVFCPYDIGNALECDGLAVEIIGNIHDNPELLEDKQ
jgi:hypothetical protein